MLLEEELREEAASLAALFEVDPGRGIDHVGVGDDVVDPKPDTLRVFIEGSVAVVAGGHGCYCSVSHAHINMNRR